MQYINVSVLSDEHLRDKLQDGVASSDIVQEFEAYTAQAVMAAKARMMQGETPPKPSSLEQRLKHILQIIKNAAAQI